MGARGHWEARGAQPGLGSVAFLGPQEPRAAPQGWAGGWGLGVRYDPEPCSSGAPDREAPSGLST